MSKFVMPDGREYPIALGEVTNKEAKTLQETAKTPYVQLVNDLLKMGPDGKTAFLWLAMRKDNHHVNFSDLEFPMGGVKFHYDEPDPTQGSAATPKPARSSSTRSAKPARSTGSRSTQS